MAPRAMQWTSRLEDRYLDHDGTIPPESLDLYFNENHECNMADFARLGSPGWILFLHHLRDTITAMFQGWRINSEPTQFNPTGE